MTIIKAERLNHLRWCYQKSYDTIGQSKSMSAYNENWELIAEEEVEVNSFKKRWVGGKFLPHIYALWNIFSRKFTNIGILIVYTKILFTRSIENLKNICTRYQKIIANICENPVKGLKFSVINPNHPLEIHFPLYI